MFFVEMKQVIENNLEKIENDNFVADDMPTPEVLKKLPCFRKLSEEEFTRLMDEKIEKIMQKEEFISRSYEIMRYIYLIVKGEVNEEWKLPNHSYKKRKIRLQ